MRFTRESYIPKGSGVTKVAAKDSDATVYIHQRVGVPYATGFRSNKTTKPDFIYRFKTDGDREKFVRNFLKNCREYVELKAARRAKRKTVERVFQVGDILYSSWGYEQTNIDFYQIIALKGKTSVVLRKIAQIETEQTGWLSEKVIAAKDSFIGEPFTKRDLGGSVKIEKYAHATKWDGRPLHQSHYH